MNKLVGGIVGIIVLLLGIFGVSFFGDGKLESVGVDYFIDADCYKCSRYYLLDIGKL